MSDGDFVQYVKLDNNVITELNKDKSHKRALFIYTYLSMLSGCRAIQTDIVKLIELFDLSVNTRSRESIKSALQILVDLNLINIYSERVLYELVSLDESIKKPRETLWIETNTSQSNKNYTLIPHISIEDILHSKSTEKIDDLFAILVYICSKIERRDNISPVMWSGMNRISKDIHITERKLYSALEELLRLDVIYYKMAKMNGGKQNFVYGLYKDKESVDNAVMIAENNGTVDKRLKYLRVSDDIIDFEDNDFVIDINLSKFFDRHDIECNDGVAHETNSFYHKHGRNKLLNVLGEYNSEIINANNKIGAYRSLLRRNI